MDAEFFQRLYRGYLGEHLISGELFAQSFEVFRLPADFGFDLVVTNQFQASQGRLESASSFPFSIQVKSRWLKEGDLAYGPNNRPEATFSYWLKEEEVDLLSKHPNSAVAFVFYMPMNGAGAQARFFFIHARDVCRMKAAGYLRPCVQGYEITVKYRDTPVVGRDQLVDDMVRLGDVTSEGARKLKSTLPETFRLNWKAKAYFQFARSSRSPDWPDLVWRSIQVCTDLTSFPEFDPLILG